MARTRSPVPTPEVSDEMTAVAENTEPLTNAADATPGTGRVARVIGPVVDVEFSVDTMPEIYNALTVMVTLSGEE